MHNRLQSALGISWVAVCGVSGIERLWVLLFHGSFYANAFYYSEAWCFCVLFLIGALAGVFLLRRARFARMLVLCISAVMVLATIVLLAEGNTLPPAYWVVGVLAAASLVSMYVSAILGLAGIGRRGDA